ncbi:hypothetical protein [Jannaschia ovalis]|uniref:Uncharacterized protein n=1 Tax=Jannaschia ovalis TaxID=3038773 RepID=A0ABY8LH69_9RHOB|nr:hypothetical protein [Jannaschia sp. GRR-S6-38]WGH79453.1 hypothetical protein P8627_04075 [Jannaschia sp. GRR-S6-38]
MTPHLGAGTMKKSLNELLRVAKRVQMSEPETFKQRVSFAYGTAHIENEKVTRKMVEKAARKSRNEENS